jgi:hypothetical protein
MVGFFLLFCSNAVGPILIVSVVMVHAMVDTHFTSIYHDRAGCRSISKLLKSEAF